MSRPRRIHQPARSGKLRRPPSETSADGASARPDRDAAGEDAATRSETDVLLDEIDRLLESNAEDFVRGYVQKGGE